MRALCVLAAAAAAGCGHVTKIEPTPARQLAAEASFGGPFGQVEGITLPLPLLTAGASYGLADRVDVDAHLHLTPLVFGVAGADVGSTAMLLRAGALGIAASARLYAFTDLRALRPYVELTPSVSWRFAERFRVYGSATGVVQFFGGPPLFALGAGVRGDLGPSGIQLEARWYQPDYDTRNLPTEWFGIFRQGGWGLLLHYDLRFGGTP